MHCLSATVLAEADLVGLGIQVPQVLIPQHPAIIEGVAVGAVVVTISGVLPPTSIMTVVSLAAEVVVEVSAEVEEHGVSSVDSPGVRGRLHIGHLRHSLDRLHSLDSWLHVGGGWHNRVVTLGSGHGINKLGCQVLGISLSIPLLATLILARVG